MSEKTTRRASARHPFDRANNRASGLVRGQRAGDTDAHSDAPAPIPFPRSGIRSHTSLQENASGSTPHASRPVHHFAPRMRLVQPDELRSGGVSESTSPPTSLSPQSSHDSRQTSHAIGSPEDVLASLANVSRHIKDLAREFNCLGYFDDDDDRPRAA
jgi:hypothetical protein